MPNFQYRLPGSSQPLSATSDVWHSLLPMDWHSAKAPSPEIPHTGPTHGDYFTAARHFLEANGFAILVGAVARRLGRSVHLEELCDIHIAIVKHGAFYHPALVTVHGPGVSLKFVLNTAVSNPGRQIIDSEYAALEKLYLAGGGLHVPTVYGRGTVRTSTGRPMDMFLGDWFNEFHEFHLSRSDAKSPLQLRVWDDEHGFFFLNEKQASELYRRAAFILTAFYNPRTFEQIFPWHHAAGDFVVRVDAAGLQVRLITARRYSPQFRDIEIPIDDSAQRNQIIMGLLFFLLTLSVRMRIDRLDGTGELVWGGEEIIPSVWEGFISGLKHSYFPWPFPENRLTAFRTCLADISVSEVFDLAQASAGGFHPEAAERALIERHMVDHVAALWTTIEKECWPKAPSD
jgi:hypothetical protein